MPEFTLTLKRTIDQSATIRLEAPDINAAIDIVDQLEPEWSDDEVVDGPELIAIYDHTTMTGRTTNES